MKPEDSGRFYVHSVDKNGKKRTFCVEPITTKIETDLGPFEQDYDYEHYQNIYDKRKHKHKGSIEESDSIINPENGFKNIQYGQNPFDVIQNILKEED